MRFGQPTFGVSLPTPGEGSQTVDIVYGRDDNRAGGKYGIRWSNRKFQIRGHGDSAGWYQVRFQNHRHSAPSSQDSATAFYSELD